MRLKIKLLREHVTPPFKKYDDDAGYDMFTPESIDILPGERVKIPLGLAVEIPKGYFGFMRARSSTAFKYGIESIGNVIDSTYRGEIHALLTNFGKEKVSITQGDKIAQLLILPVLCTGYEIVEELSPTERGSQGFGSSGN